MREKELLDLVRFKEYREYKGQKATYPLPFHLLIICYDRKEEEAWNKLLRFEDGICYRIERDKKTACISFEWAEHQNIPYDAVIMGSAIYSVQQQMKDGHSLIDILKSLNKKEMWNNRGIVKCYSLPN